MSTFTSFIFSSRMRLLKLKNHKLVVSLCILLVVAVLAWGPTAYKESWLDPFSTLNVPNRELHPHAINKLGMINSDDPFLSLYFTNEDKIRELMRNLQRATRLSNSEQSLLALENQKVQYFTLHRELSSYHGEEDFALQFYPEKGIVRFNQQFFRINEASIYNFTQISSEMTPGWW